MSYYVAKQGNGEGLHAILKDQINVLHHQNKIPKTKLLFRKKGNEKAESIQCGSSNPWQLVTCFL